MVGPGVAERAETGSRRAAKCRAAVLPCALRDAPRLRRAHCVHDTGKLRQQAITGVLYDPASVLLDLRIDQLAEMPFEPFVGPLRRLAAILAADVAGYSRLMGADEGTRGLNPTLPNGLRDRRAVRNQLAMVRRTQHVVDRAAFLGQREQCAAVEDRDAPQRCPALDD